jgi:hypothetical protein
VEVRGQFSGWNPVPGVRVPVNGSTARSTVYHFLVYIEGEPGATVKFKFYATAPGLGWESFSGDREFVLGPVGGASQEKQIVPGVTFNNVITPTIYTGNQSVKKVYLGNNAVSKIHLGTERVYP